MNSQKTEQEVLKVLETIEESDIDGDLNEWVTSATEGGKAIFFWGGQYIPDNVKLQCEIVRKFHDAPTAGHSGELKMFNQVRDIYWWPGL